MYVLSLSIRAVMHFEEFIKILAVLATVLKIRLLCRSFWVNFVNFFRFAILQITWKQLVLCIRVARISQKTAAFLESVVRRCSIKQVFFKISQNSKKNTCSRVSFLIELQAEHLFLQNTSNGGFYISFYVSLKEWFLSAILQSIKLFTKNKFIILMICFC